MQEKLVPLKIPPGFVNAGTKYLSKGRWYTGNLVRFKQGNVQPVGGWAARTFASGSVSGVPRGAVSWVLRSNAVTPVLSTGDWAVALGTTRGLYLAYSGLSANTSVADITPSAVASEDAASYWHLELFGQYLIATRNSYPGAAGSIYVWVPSSGGVAVLATDATAFGASGPSSAAACVTTDERFLFVLDRRTVQWPSQETITDWTPASTNSAGEQDLETQGVLVCGLRAPGATLLWTTHDIWAASYIGAPFYYSFDKKGDQCGAVSSASPVMLNGVAYWMGLKKFYLYDGYVRTIPCDVEDYVFNNIALAHAYKIWALPNPQHGEITWFYPSAASTEIDSYVTYCYEADHWTFGSLVRTAGVDRQAAPHTNPSVSAVPGPIMFGADGTMYDHETGNARTGATVYAESGPVEIGDGDSVMRVQRIVPDDKTEGDVTASIITSMYPNGSETTNGPYTLASPTSVRLTARQVRLKITEATAAAWRVGTVRLGVREGGRR